MSNWEGLQSAQEIFGRASVSTTEIYTKVTAKRKKQVMNQYDTLTLLKKYRDVILEVSTWIYYIA